MTYRLTLLEQLRVVRDDGVDLGRLMDVRLSATLGPVRSAASMDVEALLVGAAGWLERLGLRAHGGRDVRASTVIAVEPDRIVVRTASADDEPSPPLVGRK